MGTTEHWTITTLHDELLSAAVACSVSNHTAETRRRLLAVAPCRVAAAAAVARGAGRAECARAVLVDALGLPAGRDAPEQWQRVVAAGLAAVDADD